MRPQPVVITGPTAAGKTALTAALAELLPIEVVNADSRQVYRRLEIGTAKPPAWLRERVPHHLFDVFEPGEPTTIGVYLPQAREAVAAILARGHWPVITGGAGLYLVALLFDYAVPPVAPDPRLRGELEREAATDPRRLERRLLDLDPGAAAVVDLRNPRRVVRAIEVTLATGRPFSEQARRRQGLAWPVFLLELAFPELDARIDARTRDMFASGLLDETRRLIEEGLPPAAPGLTGIGYPQAAAVLAGTMTLEAAIEAAARATRRLARRQGNWTRRLPEEQLVRLDASVQPEALAKQVATRLEGEGAADDTG